MTNRNHSQSAHRRTTPSQRGKAYAAAIGSVALATTIKLAFDPLLGTASPYFLYFAAVMATAWYGGFRPGLIATLLSAFFAHWIFVPPAYQMSKPDWGRNFVPLVFLVEGGLICWLTESLLRSRRESDVIGNEFRLLVDGAMKHSLVLLDPTGKVKSWNHGARKVLGYSSTEIVDKDYALFFTEDDRHESPHRLIAAAAEQGRTEAEGWRVRKDGTQFRAVMSLTSLRSVRGQVTGFVLATYDVTDRWKVERALQESERQLRLMADALPVLIAYVDSDGRYQFNNATFKRSFGIDPEECRGRHVREAPGGDSFGLSEERVRAVLGGEAQSYETIATHPAGSSRHLHVDLIPHRTTDGKLPGFYLLAADITDRKAVESALRAGEERLRSIVNTAVDAIITLDRRGTIESVNLAAEQMFGHTSSEMVGQNIGLFLPMPDLLAIDRGAAESARSTMRRLIRSGREIHAIRRDGSTFPVEVTVSEVGSLGFFTGILRDVTQRMELEREVLEASAMEQRRIGRELHDHVGQELTGLEMLVDSVLASIRNSGQANEDHIRKIASGLRQTHQDVRALAHGLLPVEIHPKGLPEALEQLTRRTSEQGEQLKCRFVAGAAVQVGDAATATHLYRIAQEAIANAIRHGQAGLIEVSLRAEGNVLVLEIVDDGTGIEETPHRSAGLGLRLMEYRASLIGGFLTVEPAERKGTRVMCRIPRKIHRMRTTARS